MAETTTIKIRKSTKLLLDRYREIPSETYDEILRKITCMAEDLRSEPELSRKTLQQIDESRERTAKGEFFTMEEVADRLGIALPPLTRPSSRKILTRSAKRVAKAHSQKALSGRRAP